MPPLIVPDSFARLLRAFRGCFGAPTYQNFCLVVTGWVPCLGRHTVTAVALASSLRHRVLVTRKRVTYGRRCA